MPTTLRATPDDEKNAFYWSVADRAVRTVVEALGEGDVDAVLMIGAPTRSEATVVETDRGLYSLSDVDLICIGGDDADCAELKRRLAAPLAALNREYDSSCTGIDVAVKKRHHLASPYPIIANYEMFRSPVVLWGDEGVRDSFGEVGIEDIPGIESLVLLHNRTVEELLLHRSVQQASGDRMTAVRILYRTAKLALDLVTAFLFLQKDVPTKYTERVELFVDDFLERPGFERLKKNLSGYAGELRAWAHFKATADLTALVNRFDRSAGTDDLSALARSLWFRYTRYVEVFWKTILGSVTHRDLTEADITTAAGAYSGLEPLPMRIARTLRVLRTDGYPDELFSRARMLTRWRFASPVPLGHLTAVLAYLRFSDSIERDRLDVAVERYCPFALPGGFRELSEDGKREILLNRLGLFHETVLLGRAARRS